MRESFQGETDNWGYIYIMQGVVLYKVLFRRFILEFLSTIIYNSDVSYMKQWKRNKAADLFNKDVAVSFNVLCSVVWFERACLISTWVVTIHSASSATRANSNPWVAGIAVFLVVANNPNSSKSRVVSCSRRLHIETFLVAFQLKRGFIYKRFPLISTKACRFVVVVCDQSMQWACLRVDN